MASASQQHPSMPTRPYSSNVYGKLPERSGGPASFGVTSTRDAARLEKERAQRETGAQGQHQQNAPTNLNGITDEQREEINEAVCVDAVFSFDDLQQAN